MKIRAERSRLTISLSKNHFQKIGGMLFGLMILFVLQVFAQNPNSIPTPPPPGPAPSPKPYKEKLKDKSAKDKSDAKSWSDKGDIPAEKYIVTEPKVRVSLPCITTGEVRINGWDRNEIRVSMDGSSSLGFRVAQRNETNKTPIWVMVGGFTEENNQSRGSECLSGDEIELDVPRGATVDLKGDDYNTKIESVYKAKVENNDGNISFNNVSHGIEAKTYNGNVMVGNSAGIINLYSASGNVLAFKTSIADIGDNFTVKTISGNITLQQVSQKEIKAGTTSGSIKFNGNFDSGGQYSFGTTSGVINLLVPAESSFKVDASYGGAFRSDIPLKNASKNISGGVQKLTAIAGAGDANLNLLTFSGTIAIGKK